MFCGLQLGLVVVGTIVLCTGRLVWSEKAEVREDAARAIGCLLIAPFLLSILAGFLVVFLGMVPLPLYPTKEDFRTFQMIAVLIDGILLLGCLLPAALLFHAWAVGPLGPPRPKRSGPEHVEVDPVEEVPLPPATDD